MCSGHSLARRAPLRSQYLALCGSRFATQLAGSTLLDLSAPDGVGNIRVRKCRPAAWCRPLLLGQCRDATGSSSPVRLLPASRRAVDRIGAAAKVHATQSAVQVRDHSSIRYR
jgi:hypothetical protein